VLGAAREEGARTLVVRSGIAYVRSRGGIVRKVVDSAREHGAARYGAPPESENNSWTLVHLDELGGLYVRLLEGEAPGGTLLLATSDGSRRAREIAEPASRAGSADGRIETRPLYEALEKLVDHAYVLALDQRLTSERARRILDWTPSAPSVFEELEGGSYS
jgi:nucleoside-diphosphate-sugar epimerase